MNDELNVESVTEQLRNKIKSKMDVGKFFAGFISLFLGIAFKDLSNLPANSDPLIRYSVALGFLFILASLAFSIATLFAYDRLLMPPQFWKRTDPSINQILYQGILKEEMVKAWRRLFRPAVVTFFVGLLGFLIAVMKKPAPAVGLWLTPIVVTLLVYRFYSKIGSEIPD